MFSKIRITFKKLFSDKRGVATLAGLDTTASATIGLCVALGAGVAYSDRCKAAQNTATEAGNQANASTIAPTGGQADKGKKFAATYTGGTQQN